MAYREVNLYKVHSQVSPTVAAAMHTLVRASAVSAIAASATGFFILVGYLFFSFRMNSLKQHQLSLAQKIARLSTREALVNHVKKQVGVAQKARSSQKSLDRALELVSRISGSMEIKSFAISDQLIVNVEFVAPSIESVLSTIENIYSEDQAKRLVNPTIKKLSVGNDGKITISLSFVPVM